LKKNPFKSFAYNTKVAPYYFCLPFYLSFLIFFAYPIVEAFRMSTMEVKSLSNMTFIGLKNYGRLWNEHFFNAIKTNTIYAIVMVIIMMIVPITVATLVNSKILKCRNFFRSAIFLPTLVSTISAGIAFRLMFGETEVGMFNSIITSLGGDLVLFRQNYWPSMISIFALATWRETGLYMIYCLSALQSVPEELYESADIDGANTVQKFFKITLPQVKPILIYILTLVIINGYRMFTETYVYFNESTPNDNGLTIVRYIYQRAFQYNDMGLGCAIGVVLLFIILVINLFQLNGFGMFKKED
jgi:arabinosaccharide transport system permease protein